MWNFILSQLTLFLTMLSLVAIALAVATIRRKKEDA